MPYYVYILRCADQSLYTGISTDVARRVQEHNHTKKGASYTRSRQPVSLVYMEEVVDRSAALKREHALRQLSRAEKLQLIQQVDTIPPAV